MTGEQKRIFLAEFYRCESEPPYLSTAIFSWVVIAAGVLILAFVK